MIFDFQGHTFNMENFGAVLRVHNNSFVVFAAGCRVQIDFTSEDLALNGRREFIKAWRQAKGEI